MISGMKRVVSGTDYEKWCAGYLSRHGFRQIEMTKASGDQGIDIIATRQRIKYGIQCKFYDSPVGNSSVQEAYAGAAFYGCDRAAVMTNSTFTRGAVQLAEETEVDLWPNRDPDAEDRFLKFWHILLAVEGLCGLGLFTYVACDAAVTERTYVALCSLLLIAGSAAGIFSHVSIGANITADFFNIASSACIGYLMHAEAWPQEIPWYLGPCLMLVISLFQLIQLGKAYNSRIYERSQKQLEEEIQLQMASLGKKTGEILQEELHCHLELILSRKDKDVLVYQYHADQFISDGLPAAEFSMNQYAVHGGLQDTYQILDMGRRKIQVSIHRAEQ
jgi:hypothetical protein